MSGLLAESDASAPRSLQREYLDSLLAPDGRRARQLLLSALTGGIPAETLYLEVITPAMHEVGRLWENARISVAAEHLATQITQGAIVELSLHLEGGELVGRGHLAVVSSSPGESHALGGQMVADFLEAQGWTVLSLGADTPIHELVELTRLREPDVVALSTALPGHLLSVTRTAQLLHQLPAPPYVVVGGRAYGGNQALAHAVGADAFADDPQTLLDHLGQRFAPDGVD